MLQLHPHWGYGDGSKVIILQILCRLILNTAIFVLGPIFSEIQAKNQLWGAKIHTGGDRKRSRVEEIFRKKIFDRYFVLNELILELICLDRYVEKNGFVKTFSHFSKKNFPWKWKFRQKVLLMKYLTDLKNLYQNQITILINERFLSKCIFHKNFLFEKMK